MDVINIILFISAVLFLVYYYVRRRYSYFADRGIPFYEPVFPHGCLKGAGTKFHLWSEKFNQYYNEMKNKTAYCGIYFFITPVLLALDLDFIRTILVKDFQYFMDRGMYFNEKDDPLSAHLFNIEGSKWKNLRAKLTPTFTSGKMKMMFPTIISVADEFKTCMSQLVEKKSEIEMKDLLARFTTDVIGTCAFGLKCNSLKDPDAEFRAMGKKVFNSPRNYRIASFLMTSYKDLARRLHLKNIRADVSKFFMQAVRDTIEYREKNNVKGNDFMNLLIQLKNNGKLDDDLSTDLVSLSVEEIAAQAFVFFLAGFETSSTTMAYSLYELSQNEEIQHKAREEVINILKKYDGNFIYEAACEMKYIDQIINETLRKYPPAANLIRTVTKDYTILGTGHVLKKGLSVMIPAYAIHHDPEFYPNPESFNPDRFLPEQVKLRNPYAFLPFGEGPRVCIGLRFGLMQARIGLATLLMNFKFTTCSKSVIPIKFSPKDFILTPLGGLWLNVEKIN